MHDDVPKNSGKQYKHLCPKFLDVWKHLENSVVMFASTQKTYVTQHQDLSIGHKANKSSMSLNMKGMC
jgi:hypothetical protein